MKLSGWGRHNPQECRVTKPRDEETLRARVAEGKLIARGNGRSYGDSAMSGGNTVDMRGFDRMLGFDTETGQLVAEAGVMLDDIITTFLPRGWFPWVTPGTRFVTLGGMIAADVHGKNHHLHGSFGAFVDWIDLMGADGQVRRCGPLDNSDLFAATIGGMGLTGVILRAAFRLRRVETGFIRQETIATANLTETLAAFEAHQQSTYSVAWIDCLATGNNLGRSLITLGEHATPGDLPQRHRAAPFAPPARKKRSLPLDAPGFALNRHTVRAFNHLYYTRGAAKAGHSVTSWDAYFYPLDSILAWNRMYGHRGFVQYQSVLPLINAAAGLRDLLTEISSSGLASFLAVLKRLGPQGRGMMSFPMEGHTLALDFPATPATFALLRRLDAITLAHGGRYYLAKDARLTADTLRQSDPRADRFHQLRTTEGLTRRFASLQSERLYL